LSGIDECNIALLGWGCLFKHLIDLGHQREQVAKVFFVLGLLTEFLHLWRKSQNPGGKGIFGNELFITRNFRRGNPPCFFAFDLLTRDGHDLRTERLLDRKQELRRLLARSPDAPPKYTEYIDGCGKALFQRI
jgi:hypothetical protein